MKNLVFSFVVLCAVCLAGCEGSPDSATAAPPPAEPEPSVSTDAASARPKSAAPTGVTTFDFVDNRHLAHFSDEGIVLDLGHASGARYVQGRWNASWYDAATVDGHRIGYPRGVAAVVRFPVLQDASPHHMQVRLKPNGSQRCDVFLKPADGDEEKVGSLGAIGEGWGTYSLELPGLKAGQEYTLRLHFSRSRDIPGGRRSSAAIDWIRVGAKPVAPPRNRDELFDVEADRIALENGESISWFTVVGENANFAASVKGAGDLVISSDDAESKVISLSGEVSADLAAYAGKPVRLDFRAGEAGLKLQNPRLTAPHVAPRPRVAGPRVILVWIIDTLRADHLPAYNPKTDVVTPELDAFIDEAALFTNATVQGNSSLPTSASIFTGAYTVSHGLVRESGRLKSDHVVLGEPFAEAGWKTALFSSNGYVSKTWGFARGFAREVNPIRESRPSDTSVLWPEAREWLEKAVAESDDKVFLYINTVDPHVPYDPPEDHLKRYHTGGRVGKVSPRGTGQLLHDLAAGTVSITPAERAYMLALYKGEITDNDAWFGVMRKDLEAMGIAEETMIVVTSDHGEEFGEYGRYGHGISVNQELVDVPFIVGYRPWTKPGRKISDAVEVIDLYPTVADSAGLKAGPQVQGRSLVSDILDPSPGHPTIAFSYHNDFLRSARVGDWKYHLYNGDNDRVYDLTDNDGTWDDENLAADMPIARRAMRDAMAFQVGFDLEWSKATDGWVNNHSASAAKRLDREGW